MERIYNYDPLSLPLFSLCRIKELAQKQISWNTQKLLEYQHYMW